MRPLLLALLCFLAVGLGCLSASGAEFVPPALHTVVVPIGPTYNQGAESSCVGYAFQHFLSGGRSPFFWQGGSSIYRQAKHIDGIPLTTGTWPWAAAEVLMQKQLLAGVTYSSAITDGIQALDRGDGFVVSFGWWSGLAAPNAAGVVTATGYLAGAHAVYCYGYDAVTQQVLCQNSWGQGWGVHGTFRINSDVLQRIVQPDEVVIPRKQWRNLNWTLIGWQ